MNRKAYLYVKAFSDLGTMMDMIVLNAIVLSVTHSTIWLAATLGVRVFGGLLSSLFSGVLADRVNRRLVMILSDVVRAILIIILIPFPSPTMILIVSFLVGIMSTYFQVSFSAEIPSMFGEEKALETNALISRLRSISMVFGFLGAGIVSKWLGNQTVLGLDAVTYLISALVLLRMKWGTDVEESLQKVDKPNGVVKTFLADMQEVKTYLWSKPILMITFAVFLVETFGASSHNLGVPLLANQLDPTSSLYYGLIWGVWGLGNVLATLILPKLSWVKERLYVSYSVSTVLMSFGFISFLSNTSITPILIFAFITGIFDAASVTLYSTMMQKSDNHIRGRIFGVSSLIVSLGFGLGFVVAPLLLQLFTMPHMVWILHGLVIVSTSSALVITELTRKKTNLKSAQVMAPK